MTHTYVGSGEIDVYEPSQTEPRISLQQEYNMIYLTPDQGLKLAYLLMSICKGQGSGQTHTIPKDKPNE